MKKIILFIVVSFITYFAKGQCTGTFLGPDQTHPVCSGDLTNLEDLVPNYNTLNSIVWLPATTDPTGAEFGTYKLKALNSNGCSDSLIIILEEKLAPVFLVDTLIRVCFGHTVNLNSIYPLAGFSVQWIPQIPNGGFNETAAGNGKYDVIINDGDCDFSAEVTIQEANASVTPLLTNVVLYNMSNPLSSAFTVNTFKSIVCDQNGYVWAGSENGGLYFFNRFNWIKTKAGDIKTYKDLLVPDGFSDGSRVWAATPGHSFANAIGGGVDYVKTNIEGNKFSVQHFGSVTNTPRCFCPPGTEPPAISCYGLGHSTDSAGGLPSRFANSLVVANDKIFVGLSQSVGSQYNCQTDNVIATVEEGGVSSYVLNSDAKNFNQVSNIMPQSDIRCTAAGKRGNSVWFARDGYCVTVPITNEVICFPTRIEKYNPISNSADGFITTGNSPIPFNSNLTVRAIFTDSRNRTYVGLSDGQGIAILDENNQWILLTSANSQLPVGASVNFNAISEANDGRVFIGTNAGMLEYIGFGSLTACSSYNFYTTANGLPSNNITDIAYNEATEQLWITTNLGLCSIGLAVHSIRGNVYNVYCGKNSIKNEMQGIAISDAIVGLYTDNNVLIEQKITGSKGQFKFFTDGQSPTYKIQVNCTTSVGKIYIYQYDNLKNDSIIGMVPIPDSLIKDIKAILPAVAEECPSLSGPLGVPLPSFICVDAYDTTRCINAYSDFNSFQNLITQNHFRKVNNLFAYYMSLYIVEFGSKAQTKLFMEGAGSLFDMIEAMFKIIKVNLKWKSWGTMGEDKLLDAGFKSTAKAIEVAGELILIPIRKAKIAFYDAGDESSAKAFKLAEDIIKGIVDIFAKVAIQGGHALPGINVPSMLPGTQHNFNSPANSELKKGLGTAIQGMVFDLVKKFLSAGVTKVMFEGESYLLDPKLATAANLCRTAHSDLGYNEIHDSLIANSNNSSIADTIQNRKLSTLANVEYIRSISKLLDFIVKAADLASVLGGPLTKAAFKVFEEASKLIQPLFHAFAAGTSLIGGEKILYDMEAALEKSDLTPRNIFPVNNVENIARVQNMAYTVSPELVNEKNKYNQILLSMKSILQANDTAAFKVILDTFLIHDSIYFELLKKSNMELTPYLQNAYREVNNFSLEYDNYIDKIYSNRLIKQSLINTQVLLYLGDSLKSSYAAEILPFIDTFRILNDSAVIGLNHLGALINSNNISAPVHVVVDSIKYLYNFQPDSSGQVKIYYKNYGMDAGTNLSVKAERDPLLQLTSPDSVYIGTIMPDETKMVTYSFVNPSFDTAVIFHVNSLIDTGYCDDATISILTYTLNKSSYTVKSGNWSDTSTWSWGMLPTEKTAVELLNDVNVDIINAECGSLKATNAIILKILQDQNLTIRH